MDKYKIFHDVVTLGITCGLETPKEWVRNYEYSYMNLFAYHDIPTVEKIIWEQVVPDLYNSCHMESESDINKLKLWIYS
jgi:hypothetical protein